MNKYRHVSNSRVLIMFIFKVIAQKTVNMTEFKFLKSERKIAPVHAIEAYGGSECLNPLIRNLCTRWR
jgi:hypothetical protein